MFDLKQIWAACPYMLSVSLIKVENWSTENIATQSTIKCFKEVKID